MTVVLSALAIALLAWGVFVFNRLVRLRNQARTAWADIDVQLQRRHDLVPQLVAAVQGYAGHEAATLQAVTELRARAVALKDPAALGEAEARLDEGLGRLLAIQEAYPDLKADENFAQLQRDLVDTEEQLQYARRFYNGAVRDYTDATQRVPDVLIARTLGFGPLAFFQAEADSRAAVRVEMAR
jgi:LemA protein